MIIFGLGNPGPQYRNTRHNVGQMCLSALAKKYRKRFVRRADHLSCVLMIGGRRVELAKPISWMNLSGKVVGRLAENDPQGILVVVDDIALPLGRIRLRTGGSDGGHRGLRSVAETLNTVDFPRLRIGVGEPDIDPAEYVLSRFSRKETRILKKVINESIRGIEIAVREGYEKAQNYVNGIDLTEKSETLISKS